MPHVPDPLRGIEWCNVWLYVVCALVLLALYLL